MSLVNIVKAKFPNVPKVAGVPALLRDPASVAQNVLTGAVRGKVTAGSFAGLVSGTINQANGLVSQITGSLTGPMNAVTGAVSGALRATVAGGGSITANLTGAIFGAPGSDGALSGAIRSGLSNLTGSLSGFPADSPGLIPGQYQGPSWGIFDEGGQLAVAADSVVGFDYRAEEQISTYPIEEGGFESFNKVAVPADCRLSLTKGGSDADRAAFFAQVEAVKTSLKLFSVVTPEISYASMNAIHFDYSRKRERGATLLTVDIWLSEVRVTATASYTSTKDPAGADVVNDGPVRLVRPNSDAILAAARVL